MAIGGNDAALIINKYLISARKKKKSSEMFQAKNVYQIHSEDLNVTHSLGQRNAAYGACLLQKKRT